MAALSKPLKLPFPSVRLPVRSPVRSLSFATPEEAAAERRRRKRRLRIEPPVSSLRHNQPQQPPRSPRAPNPNAPKLPEPPTALSGKRLDLHNRILTLIRAGDLDEAALLTRHSIYSNCRPTVFTCNAVMSALLRQLRHSDMLSLHRFVTQAGVAPNVVTYNLLLQAYCDARRTDTALDHFRLLLDSSPVSPSPTTYRILAKGLVNNSRLEQALQLKDDMIARAVVSPDPPVYNFLMSGLVACGDGDKVVELYGELREKSPGGVVSDGIVFGNLMKGYFMTGREADAMRVYAEVLGDGSGVRFDAVSYNFVLDALNKHGKHEEAAGLFQRMMTEHEPPRRISVNVGSFNVMVDGFCAQGMFDEAVEVFGRMGEKKCVPDALSYNNLICHLGRNGRLAGAEELYREMGQRGVNPDEYTYVLIMEACFREGMADDAVRYFDKMCEVGLRPNANAYNKMIEGMVKAGRIDEGNEYFNRMMEKEVKPNIGSYDILFRYFCESCKLDEAMKVLKDALMDDGVVVSDEMKELMADAMKKEAREEELGRFYEEVEKEKAEALARAEEERARAEAAAREEEERKKAEEAAKAEAAAKASRAALESLMANKKLWGGQGGDGSENSGNATVSSGDSSADTKVLELSTSEPPADPAIGDVRNEDPGNGTCEKGKDGDGASVENSSISRS